MNYNKQVIYVHRYLSGDMNEEEETGFNVWVNEDPHNRKLFSDLSEIWLNSINTVSKNFDASAAFAKHKRLFDQSTSGHQISPTPTFRLFSLKPLMAIAASIILITVAWFVFFFNGSQVFNSGESQMAALTDGSKVWMKEGSKIEYTEKSKARKVTLKGKAYFDVAKDKSRPFIITAGELKVEVLGTSFTVDADAGSIFVKEGTVQVSYKDRLIKLSQNQFLQIDNTGSGIVEDKIFESNDLWFNESLSFNKTPFDVVVNDISAYFNIKFELPQGRDWSNCTFTSGSLKNNTIDEVITTLRLTYELECTKINDSSYKLSRVKCK